VSGGGHSIGAGIFNHATATSGVKVAQHPKGLTLTPAQGGGARWWVEFPRLYKKMASEEAC